MGEKGIEDSIIPRLFSLFLFPSASLCLCGIPFVFGCAGRQAMYFLPTTQRATRMMASLAT